MGNGKDFLGMYRRAKERLLNDDSICDENRNLFRRFFEEEAYTLKRMNRLPEMDQACAKTMCAYIQRFRNVNRWFQNKPLRDLTREDIRRVYDDLEDGRIRTQAGERFVSRQDYYGKVFKGRLFRLAGKADLAKEVIQFRVPYRSEVRFILEPDFRQLLEGAYKAHQRLLLWLGFDLGENIMSLLELRKSDFHRQLSPDTGEPEYRVNFRPQILKRSRTARSEITNYPETARMLDQYLSGLAETDLLFPYDYANARKMLWRACERTGVKTKPEGQRVRWKDLRSGMACDLLNKGWTRDEVNARLGHTPSSTALDKYINFLALDRHKPKRRIETARVTELETELNDSRRRERQMRERMEQLEAGMLGMQQNIASFNKIMQRNPRLEDVRQALGR